MKEVILFCLGLGLVVVLIVGISIDRYRDKQRQVIRFDQYGNEISSNVTGGLLFVYAVLAMLALGIIV